MSRRARREGGGRSRKARPSDLVNVATDLGITWRQVFAANDPNWSRPADGAAVTTWRDGGALGSSATQGGAASLKPTMRYSTAAFAGLPTLQFDGGDYLVSSPAGAAQSQPITLVAIAQATSLGGAGAVSLICDGISAARMALGYYQTGSKIRAIASSALDLNGADTNPHLFYAVLNGASSQVWKDGTSLGTGTTGAATTPTAMTIGSSYLGANFLTGHVHMVGWIVGALTTNTQGLANLKAYARGCGITVA